MPFWCVLAGLGAYLPLLTPSTTTSCPGTAPANSRRTKQVYEPSSWSLALSMWRHDYGLSMTSSLPVSHWSPGESYIRIWLPAARLHTFLQPSRLELNSQQPRNCVNFYPEQIEQMFVPCLPQSNTLELYKHMDELGVFPELTKSGYGQLNITELYQLMDELDVSPNLT